MAQKRLNPFYIPPQRREYEKKIKKSENSPERENFEFVGYSTPLMPNN